ncbi:CvpA family protein [Altererythrobacter sp. MF3-039]|uniref:CvpA family protein n=1 Tax=Altererythrobacter sp. MF3-039 TaxID=3252901 RepID=UPI00390CC36F
MTVFDIIVLVIVGVAAVGGFLRGLVQEVLSIATWILAVFAIHYLHTPLTEALRGVYDAEPATPLLAFVLLLLIPYAGMKLISGRLGQATRSSLLGPIDRVLGFGFGALKGAVIVVVAFAVVVIGYTDQWGYKGRPDWITQGRTYQLIDASVNEMVQMVAERRAELRKRSEAGE